MPENNNSIQISIVSPVYKAEQLVQLLVNRIANAVAGSVKNFEIILVEDGSPDNSWEIIKQICEKHSYVKGVKLSRNFGQHYAITAGLEQARGEWIVVMDCDLQDRPEEIPTLYQKALEGYEVVLAKRKQRKDGYFKKFYSKQFYRLLSYMTGTVQDSSIANFGIYNQKVIRAICAMRDGIRYFPAMVKWVGFKSTAIEVVHAEREIGKSSYNFRGSLNLALDVMLAFSDKPLRLTVKTGFAISIISFLFAIITLIRALRGEIEVMGYASLIISIWFLAGLIIFITGIVGLYIGKIFEKVKERPLYIVEERINVGK